MTMLRAMMMYMRLSTASSIPRGGVLHDLYIIMNMVESHDDVHEAQHGQKHPPRRRTYSMTCGPGHHFNYEEPPMTVEFEGWCFFFRYRHPVLEVIKRKR